MTASPGLYFLGLPWMYTRGSALLGWVKDDARHVAQRIDAFQRAKATQDPARVSTLHTNGAMNRSIEMET